LRTPRTFIRPLDEKEPLRRIREARSLARELDWRLQDFSVQLVGPKDVKDVEDVEDVEDIMDPRTAPYA